MSVQLKEEPGFGAIESAVRETARGRAFLEEYARRVRQSDVLTLLAMVARLERWSEEQTALLAKIEIQETTELSRTSAPIPGEAEGGPGSRRYANVPGNAASAYDRLTEDTTRRVDDLVTRITDLDKRRESLHLRTDPVEDFSSMIDVEVVDHQIASPRQQMPAITWKQSSSPVAVQAMSSSDDNILHDIAKALE